MKRLVAIVLAGGLVGVSWAAGVKRVEVKSDPPAPSGKQVWTFRMTPSETRQYELVVFECFLQQEQVRRGSDGVTRRRTVEPATYVHREKNVKMVTDLDKYISFWVPLGVDDIEKAYGRMFQRDAPVSVSRFRITAFADGKEAWSIEVPNQGIHEFQ